MTNKEVRDQVEKGYCHPRPQEVPSLIYKQMEKCWSTDPWCRPTFEFLSDFLSSGTWRESDRMELEVIKSLTIKNNNSI